MRILRSGLLLITMAIAFMPAKGQETIHWNVYFNKDGGGGRIRGIQLQGNEQLRYILSDWLQPLHPLGVAHLTSQISRNSDHAPFNAAGLPAVSFLQDPVERRA